MTRCKATLSLGDDYGDNDCTFRCQLRRGHKGDHEERGNLYGRVYVLHWCDIRTRREKLAGWWTETHYQIWHWTQWWNVRSEWARLVYRIKRALTRGE